MGRRERLEARAERRREWAEKRRAKADADRNRAHALTEGIPFGQPILVGHHSEKRHRRTLEKADNAMRSMCANMDTAKSHESKAANLSDHVERSIFSDDDNAAEACEARAAEWDASAEHANAVNKAWKRHARKLGDAIADPEKNAEARAAIFAEWEKLGISPTRCARFFLDACAYSWTRRTGPLTATNARAQARRYRERAKTIRTQEAKRAEAEAAPGGVLIVRHASPYPGAEAGASITFPDYPGREVVAGLKAAGFWWSRPSWHGPAAKIPACVLEMAEAPTVGRACEACAGKGETDGRPDEPCGQCGGQGVPNA